MDNQVNETLQVNEQTAVEPIKKKRTSLIVLGAIAVFFYLVIAIFGLILCVDVIKTEDGFAKGIGLVLVIALVLGYGSLANLIPTGLSIAGLVVSVKKKKKYGTSKLWVIGFAIMIALPFITEIALFVLALSAR